MDVAQPYLCLIQGVGRRCRRRGDLFSAPAETEEEARQARHTPACLAIGAAENSTGVCVCTVLY
jgi:hypothetical protein